MNVVTIVASSIDNVIAIDGEIPWDLPKDRERFLRLTEDQTVVVGRKTYQDREDWGNRTMLVLSNQEDIDTDEGDVHIREPRDIIDEVGLGQDYLFIAGGGEVYDACLSMSDSIYLTLVGETLKDGDNYDDVTTFPEIDLDQWNVKERKDPEDFEASHHYEYVYFERS